KLWGLGDVRIGDAIGTPRASSATHHFAPPTLEAVVVPRRPAVRHELHVALAQLAEHEPQINLRQDELRQETFVSLYGEVQKEVIQQTLASDFGIDVGFRETTTICIERPSGSGAAAELLRMRPNPFLATVGLRVDPAAVGSGVAYLLEVELGSIPFAFHTAIQDTVRETLRQGIHGWEVTDCIVTLTHSGYAPRQSHAHARFDKSMSSTGADFRNLTPLVLMKALEQAGTLVHEPIHHFHVELPGDALGSVLPLLARLQAVPRAPTVRGSACTVEGEIPAARVHELQQQLPALTRGEGVVECAFERYRPVSGAVPTRARSGPDPLDRKAYLLRVQRRV
ncbi:MAG: GTP-binding protein, partial [Myxococcota bacterium]